MKRGFTLIELLIVVAIIAILAAIAVPNFLEAQTRAKVSRTKTDMRTLHTAIESYRVDQNKPPPMSKSGATTPPGNVFNPIFYKSFQGTGTLTHAITTPIAYLTNFMFFDPFVSQDEGTNVDERLYSYHAYNWKWPEGNAGGAGAVVADGSAEPSNQQITGVQFRELYGEYFTLSVGPDRSYYNRKPQGSRPWPITLPYDPTNGTVSLGNTIRSQKETEQKAFIPMP